ncbi:MAG: hypothetical protein MRECE_14c011 [Mycoplasmataceae bacterium CE_OT135]|nr:MAG: hypothetical protein MRECE_14c011 [Mycoplasmataceae bacterium CE_OT135]
MEEVRRKGTAIIINFIHFMPNSPQKTREQCQKKKNLVF